MSDYLCINQAKYDELLSELPSDLANKFRQATNPILDYLVWTNVDADLAFESELEDRGITLDPNEYKQLKEDFYDNGFECDWTTEKVNETISAKARAFLEAQFPE